MLAADAGPGRVGSPTPVAAQASSPRLHRPIERVLFFGKNMSRTRCTGALVDGIQRHGLAVKWQNYATLRRWLKRPGMAHAWVRRTFRRFRPDLVLVFCRDLPLDLLIEMRREVPVVLWVEEAMHDITDEHIQYMRHADLVCTSNPARIPLLREHGVSNVTFLMSGFSSRFHHPEPAAACKRDVVFIGGPGAHGQRVELLTQVSAKFDTEIYGLGWEPWLAANPQLRVREPVRARGFRKLCASSRIVLGLNQFNDDPLYFSNRTWLSLACRGFHLTHYIPGLETVLQNGEHLAWYHDADECIERIGYFLGHERERVRIAEAGCRLAHDEHQYYNRIGRILAYQRGEASPDEWEKRVEGVIPQAGVARRPSGTNGAGVMPVANGTHNGHAKHR